MDVPILNADGTMTFYTPPQGPVRPVGEFGCGPTSSMQSDGRCTCNPGYTPTANNGCVPVANATQLMGSLDASTLMLVGGGILLLILLSR